MKKYIAIATLLAAGSAFANAAFTLDDAYYTNPNAWVYVWSSEKSAWGYLNSTESNALNFAGYNPAENDAAFVGFKFSYVDGVQKLTATDESLKVLLAGGSWIGAPEGTSKLYLGENVSVTGNDNGIRANGSIYFDGIGDAFVGQNGSFKLDYTDRVWVQGNVKLNGEVVMSSNNEVYNIAKIASAQQMAGEWDASNLSVKDSNGNRLSYTNDASKKNKAGYFWVEATDFTQGSEYTVKIHAVALPEPSTFGLLAGLGALALVGTRRRRR